MAKYSFRLANLLRLRESTRDNCRQLLAQTLRQDDRLVLQLADVRARQVALRADNQLAMQPGLLNVERLRDAQRYERSLQVEEAELLDQRARLAVEIEQRRAALVSADTDVRALEKLREAGMLRYQQEQERADMQRLDEVAQRQAVEKLS